MADVFLTLVVLKALSMTTLSWGAVFMIPIGMWASAATLSWMLK